MGLNYIRTQRGLPFVKRGMKVEYTYGGKTQVGKITGGNRSGNLQVLFEGEKSSKNCHPTWAMKYFDDNGDVLAEFGE